MFKNSKFIPARERTSTIVKNVNITTTMMIVVEIQINISILLTHALQRELLASSKKIALKLTIKWNNSIILSDTKLSSVKISKKNINAVMEIFALSLTVILR